MLADAERTDWLRLSRTHGVGPVTFSELIRRTGSASAAIDALPRLAERARMKSRPVVPDRASAKREIADAERHGGRFIASCEPDYPPMLAAIDAPPPVICVAGDAVLLARRAVALVGARNASAAGLRIARELARGLGEAGCLIVSGLARGVDAAAHKASLSTGTVAVLAGGIDQIYPPEHAGLFEEVVRTGAAITEAPFGRTATARDFPKRNRLISGLSLAVVVVEAAERSGSLITARCALEQGREVMAVPGSPLDPRAKGSNGLIRQGAHLVETAEDVIRAIEGLSPIRVAEPAGGDFSPKGDAIDPPQALIEAVRDALTLAPVPIADLAEAVDAPYRLVAVCLMELELQGVAATHVGGLASRRVEE
ncbi:DNA-protecting protein DprA [bacterium]|nr:DNA-protecting protein DprA [bacterium]